MTDYPKLPPEIDRIGPPPLKPGALDAVLSPALIAFEERIEHNISVMKSLIGDFGRLRSHVKTNKCGRVLRHEVLTRLDRKHACAKDASFDLLEQAGVALASDDALVDALCLLALEDFPLDHLSAHRHREIAHGGVAGKRESVDAFEAAAGIVVEDLLYGDARRI